MVSFFSQDVSNNTNTNTKTKTKTNYTPVYASVIFIVLLSIIYMYLLFVKKKTLGLFEYLKTILQVTGLILALGGVLSGIIYLLIYAAWPLALLNGLFNIFIVILALALVYKFLNIKSNSSSSSWSLITSAIFYIPCLVIQFINYLKYEYNISTKTEWLLLFAELLIIGVRIVLPYLYGLYNKLFGSKGDVIEAGPIYLNKENIFGIIRNKAIPKTGSYNKITKNIDNYNYAISAWIWINPQPPSTSAAYNTSTSLFDYGNIVQLNFYKNNLVIMASTTKDNGNTDNNDSLVKIYMTKDFNYQKWNHILINYSGGTLDVFINDDLVASRMNITPIMYNNRVTAGSNNGIQGGIKDIVYYDKALTRNDVTAIFSKGL